ncbi:Ynd [hydrothermal vent metagenome]|uniref:Ynd n=1 Tax=hydrothermal vent metagenome TaxID=652676 RepID=A0A3B1AYA0_9ZZZZ
MVRAGDLVTYEGAIYALQRQLGLSVHPGGRNALSILGKSHYLSLSQKKVILFGEKGERLPAWFKNHDWGLKIEYHSSSFLPANLGFTEVQVGTFTIKVSGATRAMMECLYLVPKKQELFECYELMEGLTNLRPNQVQELLENCNSVKVKRLFMYLAEKCGHSWVKYINMEKIDFGSGKRSLVKNGVYVQKYQITVPRELEAHDKPEL